MAASLSSDGLKDFGIRLAACFLILWTPFFFFSGYRGHPVPAASLVYSAVLFAIAALVVALIVGRGQGIRRIVVFTLIVCLFLNVQFRWFDDAVAYAGAVLIAGLFWLIRQHLAVILATIFATVLVASVVVTPADQYRDRTIVENQGADETLPPSGLIIHMIMDEFAGIQGIPDNIAGGPALKSDIADFFQSYGFALQRRAISEYTASRSSISGIVNFEASATPEKNFHGKRPYVLKNNAYFELLHQRNYRIHVYQSTYMDFCAEAPVPLALCFTYRYDGTDWLKSVALGDYQKMTVLLGMYFNLPGVFESLWKSYVGLRDTAEMIGLSLPAVMAWDGSAASANAASAFDTFRETVVAAPSGTAHFAHLLLPHSPYVFDRDCSLRTPPFDWLSHRSLHRKSNSAAGRERRYDQYFAQVRCTLRHLRTLFDGLKEAGKWADTTIILHGDHGSRIYETAPRAKNRQHLTAQDLTDGYSTLFAVKSTKAQAIGNNKTTPISRLLARVMGASAVARDDRPPVVYLEGRDDDPWTAIPWPESP